MRVRCGARVDSELLRRRRPSGEDHDRLVPAVHSSDLARCRSPALTGGAIAAAALSDRIGDGAAAA
jgi:hypothetical protein